MKFLLKIFLIVFFVKVCVAKYENFKAYDVTADAKHFEQLIQWQDEEDVDFWRLGAPGRLSRVMIPPKLKEKFEDFLISNRIEHKMVVEDVGEIEKDFEVERIERLKKKNAKSAIEPSARPNFDVYWTSEEIDKYSRYLATNFPHLVTREVLNKTFDGNDIFALKISRGGFGNKPIIFMDGGMHAREWVSQATVMYFVHRLIEDPETSNELLSNLNWIIIPNLNPDGYNWAFTENRLWRKNRNLAVANCDGIDLNRNFAFSWRAPTVVQTCRTTTFPGSNPLSEVESFSLNNYMTRYRKNVRMYISVHSFGDMVLYPWGFSGSPGWIDNWQQHHDVGTLWADAIRAQTGKNYAVGNIADILGNAFGASDDHMAGNQLVNLVYTLELTGGGRTGFEFPEAEIGGLNRETYWGYRAFGLYVSRNY